MCALAEIIKTISVYPLNAEMFTFILRTATNTTALTCHPHAFILEEKASLRSVIG